MILSKPLLSFSGGQDSTSLLFYNLQTKPTLIHLNHLLQKDNFCFSIHYFRLQYFFALKHHYCTSLKSINTEFAGTIWRYKIFERISSLYTYPLLWIGKSQTDYHENFFMDLLKGVKPSFIINKKIKYYFSYNSFIF